MKPTKEQIQWFWEQCGLKTTYEDENQYWYESGGALIGKGFWEWSPVVDLNNLVEYAVPEMEKRKFRMMITYNNIKRPGKEYMYRVSFCKFKTNSRGKAYNKNLEDALFEALYKALGGKE